MKRFNIFMRNYLKKLKHKDLNSKMGRRGSNLTKDNPKMKHANQNSKNLLSKSISTKMRCMRELRVNIKIQKVGIINKCRKRISARFHMPMTRFRALITKARTWRSIWTSECLRVQNLIQSLKSKNSKKCSKMKIILLWPMVITLFQNAKHLLVMPMKIKMKKYLLSHRREIRNLKGLEEAYSSKTKICLPWPNLLNRTNCFHNSKFKNKPLSRSRRLKFRRQITHKIFLILVKLSRKRQPMKLTMNLISFSRVPILTILVMPFPSHKTSAQLSIWSRNWLFEISLQDN